MTSKKHPYPSRWAYQGRPQTQRCEGTCTNGHQCKRAALKNYNLCITHGWNFPYFIQFMWQEKPNDHWRNKKKAVWPILFETRELAHAHMMSIPNLFMNMTGRRKLSASVERSKRGRPVPNLREVQHDR